MWCLLGCPDQADAVKRDGLSNDHSWTTLDRETGNLESPGEMTCYSKVFISYFKTFSVLLASVGHKKTMQ